MHVQRHQALANEGLTGVEHFRLMFDNTRFLLSFKARVGLLESLNEAAAC